MASIVVKDCVCRQNCAPNGKNLGIVNGTFEVMEERERNGIMWYRIDEDKWIQSGSGVELLVDDSADSEISAVPNAEDVVTSEDTVQDASISEEHPSEEHEEPEPSESDIADEDDEVQSDEVHVDEESPTIPDDITNDSIMYAVGDTVTFSGSRHYASPKGDGGAFVKPCMAKVVEVHHGEDYPLKLHRCNSAGNLISAGRMGFVSTRDVYPI